MGVAAGTGDDDLGARHRRARGTRPVEGVPRCRRHPHRHRGGLRRGAQRAPHRDVPVRDRHPRPGRAVQQGRLAAADRPALRHQSAPSPHGAGCLTGAAGHRLPRCVAAAGLGPSHAAGRDPVCRQPRTGYRADPLRRCQQLLRLATGYRRRGATGARSGARGRRDGVLPGAARHRPGGHPGSPAPRHRRAGLVAAGPGRLDREVPPRHSPRPPAPPPRTSGRSSPSTSPNRTDGSCRRWPRPPTGWTSARWR